MIPSLVNPEKIPNFRLGIKIHSLSTYNVWSDKVDRHNHTAFGIILVLTKLPLPIEYDELERETYYITYCDIVRQVIRTSLNIYGRVGGSICNSCKYEVLRAVLCVKGDYGIIQSERVRTG